MTYIKFDWKGVNKLLKNLKPHKATDPDAVPSFILKTAATELAPALTRLFQMSLDSGLVPKDWKEAPASQLQTSFTHFHYMQATWAHHA